MRLRILNWHLLLRLFRYFIALFQNRAATILSTSTRKSRFCLFLWHLTLKLASITRLSSSFINFFRMSSHRPLKSYSLSSLSRIRPYKNRLYTVPFSLIYPLRNRKITTIIRMQLRLLLLYFCHISSRCKRSLLLL